jgi:hypothetical protein
MVFVHEHMCGCLTVSNQTNDIHVAPVRTQHHHTLTDVDASSFDCHMGPKFNRSHISGAQMKISLARARARETTRVYGGQFSRSCDKCSRKALLTPPLTIRSLLCFAPPKST